MRRTSALAILAIIFVTWFAWAELLEENIEILTF